MNEVKVFIADLFNHGLNDSEVVAELTKISTLRELGRMVTTRDLIAIIRDLMRYGK
jgi:hypothetical protein